MKRSGAVVGLLCAWVLWQSLYVNARPHAYYFVDAFDNRVECDRRKTVEKRRDLDKDYANFGYLCLPSGLHPRQLDDPPRP